MHGLTRAAVLARQASNTSGELSLAHFDALEVSLMNQPSTTSYLRPHQFYYRTSNLMSVKLLARHYEKLTSMVTCESLKMMRRGKIEYTAISLQVIAALHCTVSRFRSSDLSSAC
eukprot:6192357-Pleurochrysis_carterae.AAC.1